MVKNGALVDYGNTVDIQIILGIFYCGLVFLFFAIRTKCHCGLLSDLYGLLSYSYLLAGYLSWKHLQIKNTEMIQNICSINQIHRF